MPDTPRTVTELLAIFADNASGDISAQDMRDFVESLANPVDAGPAKSLVAGHASVVVDDQVNGFDVHINTDDTSVQGVSVEDQGSGGVGVRSDDGGVFLQSNNTGVTIQFGPTRKIGFYGQTPTTQPAHPVTLQNVIDALVALGLVAGP